MVDRPPHPDAEVELLSAVSTYPPSTLPDWRLVQPPLTPLEDEMQTQELKTQNTVIIDGFVVDAETGEILGHADVKPEFRVDTEEAVDWVLRKMGRAEAELVAVDNDPDVLWATTILANAERIRKEKQKRLDWLHARFDAELGAFAKAELARTGAKGKTYKRVTGAISFRTVKGGLRVADEHEAIQTAKILGWEGAIKVKESFLISALPDEVKAELVAGITGDTWSREDGCRKAFTVQPDVEKVEVKPGVLG